MSATNIVISNATIPGTPSPDVNGPGTCVINVVITSSIIGIYLNVIPAGSFAGGFAYDGTGAPLGVNNPPNNIAGLKGFAPASTPQGGTALLTLTLTNVAATSATNVAVTDDLNTLGGGITIASTPLPTNSCGGVLTAVPGASSFSLTGGTIGSVAACNITVPVQVAAGAITGVRTNSIGAGSITTSVGRNGFGFSGDLTILSDIGVAKAFSPNSVPQTGSSILTITLSNAAGGANAAISTFVDNLATLGPGITISASPASSNTCGGTLTAVPGSTTISLSGGVIFAGGTCLLMVPVTVSANAAAGVRVNTIAAGALVTNQGNNTDPVTANLTLLNALTLSKAFSLDTIGPSQLSRLTVTVAHANGAVPFSGIALTDNLPVGHTVAAPPNVFSNCSGAVTAVAGSTGFSLSGGSLPAGATSCIVAVDVRAPAGTGASINTIPAAAVSTAQGVTNAAAASASLTRAAGAAVTLNKNFTPTNISGGQSSVLSVLITNPNGFALTSVAVTDTLPAGMTVFDVPADSTTCGGSVIALAGAGAFALVGGSVPANGSCAFQANITSVVGGNSINTIPVGVLSSAQSVTNANSPSATLQVLFNLNLSKAFSPPVTQAGSTSTLIVTIYNSNTTAIAGSAVAALQDVLPAGLQIANATSTTSCGGVVQSSAGGALIAGSPGFRLDGGSFAASSQCTVSVQVSSVPAGATGSFVNTIPANNLQTVGGTTNPTPASATLTFVANPILAKSFNPISIIPGGVSTLTFTLTNPNSAILFPSGLTNASFTDLLPAGISILAPGPASGTCSGAAGNVFSAGQTSLSFSGLQIAPASSCTVQVLVTAPSTGVRVNTVTGLVTQQTPIASTPISTATLTVLLAPAISKAFVPAVIASGGTGTAVLTITLTNPNATPVLLASPGVLDQFPTSPAGMTVFSVPAATTCAGGTLQNSAGGALNAGDAGIRLNNGTIPANGNCLITVTVFVPQSGTYLNSSAAVTSTNAGVSPAGATATVVVMPLSNLTVSKTDGRTSVLSGSTTQYTVTFTNVGPADATGAMVSDTPGPGLSCTIDLTCSATGGANCPTPDLAAFTSTGLKIPSFPNGGQVVFGLTCLVSASGF